MKIRRDIFVFVAAGKEIEVACLYHPNAYEIALTKALKRAIKRARGETTAFVRSYTPTVRGTGR